MTFHLVLLSDLVQNLAAPSNCFQQLVSLQAHEDCWTTNQMQRRPPSLRAGRERLRIKIIFNCHVRKVSFRVSMKKVRHIIT